MAQRGSSFFFVASVSLWLIRFSKVVSHMMSLRKTMWMGVVVALLAIASDAQTPATQRPAAPVANAAIAPLDNALPNQYCIGCHNQRAKTAGLMLDTMDYANIGKDAATWEKVIRKIKTGMMPPSGARRPERATLDGFASEIEKRLDSAAASHPNPGTTA